jgi:prepilin-type processing-associated H-X9-DG protein
MNTRQGDGSGVRPVPWRRFRVGAGITCLVATAIAVILVVLLLIPVYPHAGAASRRVCCKVNLKYIGLALQAYHDHYGTFPPAYIADSAGRPMHSWRVLLLPYLECWEEYKEYRFDEPWDSAHNRIIVRSIAAEGIYRCPSDIFNGLERRDPGLVSSEETNYMMIVGPGTVSEGGIPGQLKHVDDDPSTTLIVAEVYGTGVSWAEPRDLDVRQMSFRINGSHANGIRGRHDEGANVLFCDGKVQLLSVELEPRLVKAMTTIAGKEIIPKEVHEPMSSGRRTRDSGP